MPARPRAQRDRLYNAYEDPSPKHLFLRVSAAKPLRKLLVDLGRAHHAEVSAMEGRISAIRTDIGRFIADTASVAALVDLEFDANDFPIGARIADELIELQAGVVEQSTQRSNARNELKSAEAELADREDRLRRVEHDMAELLTSAGAKSANEFRQRAETFALREKFQATMDSAVGKLRRTVGSGRELEALKARLAASNPQSVGDEIRQFEADLQEIDLHRSELDTERGSVRKELDQLLGEAASSKLRVERQGLLEQMRGNAREWVVRTIAEGLLREAQGKFERERQPGVLRHAQKFFQEMTGERYETIFSPLGSSEIHATTADGFSKKPSELSRGTREQLFLSLRFGLIRELGQRSERLPVIVDEALVNFDPERGLRAAQAFVEFAELNQVLVFTCHPQIVDWFVNAAAELGAPQPHTIRIE